MSLRLLLVEDYQLVAWALRLLVNDAGHYVCGIAPCPDRALAIARQERPDLALMDIRLEGGTSGVEAVQRLWEIGVPSLYVTAFLNDAVEQAGALGTLVKPYSRADICLALEAAERILSGGEPGRVPDSLTLYRFPTLFEGQ